MLDRLEKLRAKPKHVRDRYAFWVAVGVTLCVVGVWVTTLPPRLAVLRDGSQDLSSDNSNSAWSRASAAVRSGWNGWQNPDTNAKEQVLSDDATSSPAYPMEWTEAAASAHVETKEPARTILIGTTSASVASTSSSTNVLQ